MKTLGILSPNCIEYPMVIAGAAHAGVTVTTLNPGKKSIFILLDMKQNPFNEPKRQLALTIVSPDT